MTNHWKKYQGALIWTGLPHQDSPSYDAAAEALNKEGGLFARWTSEWDTPHPTEWWYCICDQFTPMDKLTAKQRYRVKKGLSQCQIENAKTSSRTDKHAIFEVVKASFEDYPAEYRPTLHEEVFSQKLQLLFDDDQIDLWLVYSNSGELVGYCQCTRTEDVVWLTQVKVPTKYLSMEVNAALGYTLCEQYLQNQHFRYICDGERNIKHITNYQDFLVRVLNFRLAYCRLNIAYTWWVKVIVYFFYPMRNVIRKVGKLHPIIYNLYCVLLQEQINLQMENIQFL